LSPLSVRRPSVRPLTFHILIRLITRLVLFYKIVNCLVAIPSHILVPTDSRTRQNHLQTFRQIQTTKDIYQCIFSNSSHLEWKAGLSDTTLKGTHPRTIPARFGLIWFRGFREDLNVKVYEIRQTDDK
jgi:hypothetical protein